MGFRTPPFGRVKDVVNRFTKKEYVVYTDIEAHQGEGKLRLPHESAVRCHPDEFASLYIEPPFHPKRKAYVAVHYRCLKIGDSFYWMEYLQTRERFVEWRSNVGEVEITLLHSDTHAYKQYRSEFHSIENLLHYTNIPLLAIDLIPHPKRRGLLFAIDMNISPQIKGTGLEGILEPSFIVKAIKESFGKQIG
ncbi:hypothetical protein [Cytobacillus spartinae]